MERQTLIEQKNNAEARLKGSADWFFWIAGLSLINTAVTFFGGNLSFIFGLGLTQLVDGVAMALVPEFGNITITIALVIDIVIALVFFLFGKYARKGYKWIFIVGMAFYTLDGLVFLMVRDYLSIAFHLYVLYALFRGLKAIDELKAINKSLEEHPEESTTEHLQDSNASIEANPEEVMDVEETEEEK